MWRRKLQTAALSTAAILIPSVWLLAQVLPAAPPFPAVTIPGLPVSGNCCLFQLHQVASGNRAVAATGAPWACPRGANARFATKFAMKLSLSDPCPQEQDSGVNLTGALLTASGNTHRRADGFADFFGDVAIQSPTGAILFKGSMEVFDQIASHHLTLFQCERCVEFNHLEGWLVAQGAGAFSNVELRAMIAGKGAWPVPTLPAAAVNLNLDGVLIKCQ